MADNTIATYYVQLEPTTKGITGGIEKEFSGVGKSGGTALSVALGNALSGTAGFIASTVMQSISGGINAITDFGKVSVETGAQFDSSMSQVAATMGTTVDKITDLRDFAQEMGRTTTFSATQAADALNYMALAGYDANTSMGMLPNVLNLAAAGNFDLARASDMVTDTQTAFGISLERTSQMVDEMAKAASTGNTSVEQLGDAFLVVGGLTQELNGGLIQMGPGVLRTVDGVQELEIALTAMANAGIKGSEAGTHMRNMLLKLSDPTKDGAMALEAMGVSVFNTEGEMRSLADIFGDLSNKMDDMTQQEKISTISDLFNTRDIASAEALLNAVDQDWDEIGKSILQAEGAAQQMADTQLDNLAGDVTIFRSALEGVQIAISDQLTPTLREFVQLGTGGLQAITEGFKENGFEGAFENLVVYISDKGPEIIEKMGKMVPTVITGIKDIITKLFPEMLKVVSEDIIPTLLEVLPPILTMLGEVAPQIVTTIINAILDALPSVFETAITVIVSLANGISAAIPELIPAVLEVIEALVDILLDNIDEIIDAATTIIIAICDGLVGNIDRIVMAMNKITYELVAHLLIIIPQIIGAAVEIIMALVTALVSTLMKMISGDYWNEMLNAIVDSFLDVDWDGIGYDIIDGIVQGFKKGWETLKTTAVNMADSLKKVFTDGFDIHSPSRIFEGYGEMINAGLALGIENDDVSVNAMKNMSDDVQNSFNPSVAAAGAGGGNITIPVYIGNELIQTIVVDALNMANYRSGGR